MNGKTLLHEALEWLEFPPSERKFYETVVVTKQPRIADVIRLTGLRRPTAYQALKRLKEKGLLITDYKKYGQRVTAVSAHKLLQFVSARQRQARKIELKLRDHLSELQELYHSSFSPPQVEQFEGPGMYQELHQRALNTQSRLIRFLGNIEDYLDAVDVPYREDFIRERLRLRIRLKIICNPSERLRAHVERDRDELRERKLVPPDRWEIKSSLAVFDDTVIFFSLVHEQLALSITSSGIANLVKGIFDEIWEKY